MTDYNGHTTNYTYTARGELASITAPGILHLAERTAHGIQLRR